MKFISATPGEDVYGFLNRVLNMAYGEIITYQATHNDVTIVVYPRSFISDLCDKYDLAQKLSKPKGYPVKH